MWKCEPWHNGGSCTDRIERTRRPEADISSVHRAFSLVDYPGKAPFLEFKGICFPLAKKVDCFWIPKPAGGGRVTKRETKRL